MYTGPGFIHWLDAGAPTCGTGLCVEISPREPISAQGNATRAAQQKTGARSCPLAISGAIPEQRRSRAIRGVYTPIDIHQRGMMLMASMRRENRRRRVATKYPMMRVG